MRRMSSDVIHSGGLSIYSLRSFSVSWFMCALPLDRSISHNGDWRKSCGCRPPTRTGYGYVEFFVNFPVTGINAVIAIIL